MAEFHYRHRIIRLLHFNQPRRILLYRRLSAFIGAGVPFKDALEKIHQRYIDRRDARALMLRHWLQHIKAGHTVADAMRPWAPTGECLLLEAAQTTGNLAEGFSRSAWLSELSGRIKGRFASAISYPIIILSLLLLVTIWFSVSLVPTFAEAIPAAQWQGQARQLYQVSELLRRYGLWLPAPLLCLLAVFLWSIPRWRGPWRTRLDSCPPYSFYRMYQATVFLVSLAAMTRAQIPLYEALGNIQQHSCPWLRDKVKRMRLLLQTGAHPGDALSSSLFDQETLDDLHVYGMLGDLNTMLETMSEYIVQVSLQRVAAMSKTLNYLLLALAGGQIAWMLSALYSLPDGLTQ